VWFGKQAVDDDAAQVGPMVATLLGRPCVTVLAKFELAGQTAKVEREIEGGREQIEVPLPAVFTTDKGLNEPRYASLKGIMAAKKKVIEERAVDLGSAGDRTTRPGDAPASQARPHRRRGRGRCPRTDPRAARGGEGPMSILVYVEQRDGHVRPVAREALGEAKRPRGRPRRAGGRGLLRRHRCQPRLVGRGRC
jgi:hypothetical protein